MRIPKKIILKLLLVALIITSCDDEEDKHITPNNFTASDGFYVGCIHIEFEREENMSVQLERREKGTGNWEIVAHSTASTYFEDNEGYTETGMPPGKVFEYRLKNAHGNNMEYSAIEEGFAFEYVPITQIEIESYPPSYDGSVTNLLRWNAGNHNSFLNESDIYFNVCRSTDSLGTYEVIATVGEDRSYTDVIPSTEPQDVFYRIDIFYEYTMTSHRGAGFNYTTAPLEGVIFGTSSGNSNPTINYSSTSLGQIAQALQGGIPILLEKYVNGSLYVGLLNNAGATGYGIPELYKLNGASWIKEWSINPPSEFDKVNYAIASNSHFIAGIQDSLCVYEWNGSAWGNNIAPDNLGQADAPSSVSIEVSDDNLYMAITQHPNYDLQVLRYNGSTWDKIGGNANGIIESGTINDLQLLKSGSSLYLQYIIDNTLYIKHLADSSWVSDLTWTKDNIADIDFALSGNVIYFISGTTNSSYRGGLYKATSATTAEEIISNTSDEWFQFPLSIAVDSDYNIIVASMKYNESTTSFYPNLNFYDGLEWKTISGDFSNGIDPAVVCTIGTDLIYVYGDKASENAMGEPTAIKSLKFSKNQ